MTSVCQKEISYFEYSKMFEIAGGLENFFGKFSTNCTTPAELYIIYDLQTLGHKLRTKLHKMLLSNLE